MDYKKCSAFRSSNICAVNTTRKCVNYNLCCFTCRWNNQCEVACSKLQSETVKSKPDNNTYEKIGEQVGGLVAEKQHAYGDMIRGAQEIFRILYPDGIKPEKYDDALLVLRVMDKIGRICRGDKKAFGESPWRDICGYAILGAEQDERTK